MFTSTSFADNTKLIGAWVSITNVPIKIHLKSNNRFVYTYKMLIFSGSWSANDTELTLKYKVFGSKRSKVADYTLRNGFLTLRSNEHANVTLKRSF